MHTKNICKYIDSSPTLSPTYSPSLLPSLSPTLFPTLPTVSPSQAPTTHATIDITACDGWNYGSISNSMQLKLTGIESVSSYGYVNSYSQLPINGNSQTFDQLLLSNIHNVTDLYSIHLIIDDPFGYCIKSLSITLDNNKIYKFDNNNYFGNGLILASECDYSYKFINNKLPLIKCIQGQLDLIFNKSRGIYKLDLHSCIGSNCVSE